MIRRDVLLRTGAFAMASLFTSLYRQSPDQQTIPTGGVPSIAKGGVIQFDYPDGTRIRVYDDKIETTKPNSQTQTTSRSSFQIDVQKVTPPPVPGEPTLKNWLDTLAAELRETIDRLLRHDSQSNKNYDDYEHDLSLTVYKKIGVRLNCIRKLTGVL